MFALEETRHGTAATAVVKSSSFTKEEVLTTQSTANYSLSRKKQQFCNLAESTLLDKYGSWHSRDWPMAVGDGRAQQSNLETRTYMYKLPLTTTIIISLTIRYQKTT